jgi:hypothetical protein
MQKLRPPIRKLFLPEEKAFSSFPKKEGAS